ncbi:MAG TPA: methyltransferase [Halieaceae bacterium]|nr:methyltransferase [Halieaceae bacterium]
MLLEQPSVVGDFYDDEALRTTYHGELIALIKALTGARRVEVFDDTRRSASVATQRERGIREPANIVHNDYTAASGPRRLNDFFTDAPEEAEALRQQRFAIINAWRPINGPVYDQPLVLCDAGSIADGDLVAMERRAEERIGELQVALYNPGQRWYYFPRMRPEEVLLFKTYDSAEDGRARFTPHSSFADPAAPRDAPARESLESRCLVFF